MPAQRWLAIVLGVLSLAEVILLARGSWPTGAHSVAGSGHVTGETNTYTLGRALFTTYLLPFEITSALLVIAVIGAVLLARRPRGAAAVDTAGPVLDTAGPAGPALDSAAPASDQSEEGVA
jgi:NADH-quinone oxidoreductase subunit J